MLPWVADFPPYNTYQRTFSALVYEQRLTCKYLGKHLKASATTLLGLYNSLNWDDFICRFQNTGICCLMLMVTREGRICFVLQNSHGGNQQPVCGRTCAEHHHLCWSDRGSSARRGWKHQQTPHQDRGLPGNPHLYFTWWVHSNGTWGLVINSNIWSLGGLIIADFNFGYL